MNDRYCSVRPIVSNVPPGEVQAFLEDEERFRPQVSNLDQDGNFSGRPICAIGLATGARQAMDGMARGSRASRRLRNEFSYSSLACVRHWFGAPATDSFRLRFRADLRMALRVLGRCPARVHARCTKRREGSSLRRPAPSRAVTMWCANAILADSLIWVHSKAVGLRGRRSTALSHPAIVLATSVRPTTFTPKNIGRVL